MTSLKSIERIFTMPSSYNMVGDGFRVYNYIPGPSALRERISPFLMLDFNPTYDFGPSSTPRGVNVHPHKGFETVTIAYKGKVAHHDSKGNSGIINPGDVQWMTAGAGILHKEYHETEFSKQGGPFEMVQLWVNLPSKNKSVEAGYQSITASEINSYKLANGSGEARVIAGQLKQITGSARTFTPMNVFDLRLRAEAQLEFDVSPAHNSAMLVIEGDGIVNGSSYKTHDFVLFRNEGETVRINSSGDSVLLFLSGEPIHEPIVQYGPFVMNSMHEIQTAIEEFNAGKFGHLS